MGELTVEVEAAPDGDVAGVEIARDRRGRRRWPQALKAQIIAESFAPGAETAEVARRYGIGPHYLHAWRRDVREGRFTLPGQAAPAFAPVIVDDAAKTLESNPPPECAKAIIEIEAHGVVIRVRECADVSLIEAMVRALAAPQLQQIAEDGRRS
jgi:transposase